MSLLALVALLPPPTQPIKNHPNGPQRRNGNDGEFGEAGRHPRFGSGWWMVPGLLIFAIAILAFMMMRGD